MQSGLDTEMKKICGRAQRGFTMIELIIVISLVAIMAAVAMPRLLETQDNAHRAAVSGTGGALSSAVILLRAQWIANNTLTAVNAVQGYGLENIATSADGWPTDAGNGAGSNNNPVISSAQRCVNLWRALLVANAPTVSSDALANSDYLVDTVNGNCRYTYKRQSSNSQILYNARNGEVITTVSN